MHIIALNNNLINIFLHTAGIPNIPKDITHTVNDSDPLNPVFNLTCISTGGPAQTVTWRQDGRAVSYGDNHMPSQTVTDMSQSIYENVLTVKGNEPGEYQCCVRNVRRTVCRSFTMKGNAFVIISGVASQ